MSIESPLVHALEQAENVVYGRESLPSARDRQIRDALLSAIMSSTFEELERILPEGSDRTLRVFVERAASIAVRDRDQRELDAGLLAAALALTIAGDLRDVLVVLPLLYRAAEKIGRDPALEFEAAYKRFGEHAVGLLNFAKRRPEAKRIQAMGYKEGEDDSGFRFIRTW